MKRKIRRGVFETNSSSSHSVSITSGNDYEYKLPIDDEDNKVHVPFGEFGWEIENYNDAYTKLQYALTMVIESEGCTTEEEFYESDGFNAINELIKDVCDCDGVVVDNPKIEDMNGWVSHNGYIDHQSVYGSLQSFLNDYGVELEEFIFDRAVTLHTDNDNH